MFHAHKAVVKASVQARLPAMGHMTPGQQERTVELMVWEELERRAELFPEQEPTFQALAESLADKGLNRFWRKV